MRRNLLHLVAALVVGALTQGPFVGPAAAQAESTRSWPKDDTFYSRPAVPEDTAPSGRGAISPLPAVFIVDVAVLAGTGGGTEPSIAVNPAGPDQIVIHAGFGGWNGNASVWESTDGGVTWTLQSSIPAPPGGVGTAGCPCDTVIDYGRNNLMSGTFLATPIYSGTTSNPASAAAWNWFTPGGVTQTTNLNNSAAPGAVDQPWLVVTRDPTTAAQDDVYVGYDDFTNGLNCGVNACNMRVSVSYGANPPNFTVDNQSGTATGGVNPGHRLAVDPRTGFVYSAFQRNIAAGAGGSKNIDYMLNRSTDGGATWPLGGGGGITVANADSTQPTPKFGTVNALLGGVLHLATDPTTGDIYYVYGNRDAGTGNNRLAIRRIVSDGAGGLLVGAEHFVTGQVQAAIPSVAVLDDGTVGVFYYTFDGFSSDNFPIFTGHLALSDDQGMTFTDISLLMFLSAAADSGNSRQRVLGDYVQLKTLSNCFYGVFTGNGVPFGRTVAQHDPIFYQVCAGPRISLNPSRLDFGLAPVNPVGGEIGVKSVDFNICNVGNSDLVVQNVALQTPNPAFSVIPPPPSGFPLPISPDFCHTIEVRCDPVVSGTTTASVQITSNDADDPLVSLPVSCTGAVPTAQVSPNPVSFGNVPTDPVGGEIGFKDLSLKVRNEGNSNLSVTAIASVGGNASDFVLLTPVPGFPTIISPDAEFDFQVRCDPSAAGPRTTTVRVTSNSGGSAGATTDVTANCTGTVPDINVTGSLDFGEVKIKRFKDLQIEILNTGVSNLSITNMFLTGDPAFTIQGSPTLPLILSPDANALVSVRCAPASNQPKVKTATLTIVSNDPDEASVTVPAVCTHPSQ